MFKTTFFTASLLTVCLGILLTSTANAEGLSRLQLLADVCAVCHGTDGRGAGKVPKLNGELKINDFTETMYGFASGEERSTVMKYIAKGLTEKEISELANHFAQLNK